MFFQGCYGVLRTYSLELEQTSQKFVAFTHQIFSNQVEQVSLTSTAPKL